MSEVVEVQMPGQPPEPTPTTAAERPRGRSFIGILVRRVLGRWGALVGLAWVVVLAACAVFAPFIANSHPILMLRGGQWSSPLLGHLTNTDVVLLICAVGAMLTLPWRRLRSSDRLLMLAVLTLWAVLGGLWKELVWPFVTSGQAGWVAALQAWNQAEPGATETPGLPVGSFLFWAVLWLALLTYVAVLGVATWAEARRRRLPIAVRGVHLAAVAGVFILLLAAPIQPPQTVVYEQYREALAEGEVEKAYYVPLPYSPADRLRDQPEMRLSGPSLAHPLGVTANGADLLANMIYGSRIALSIGFIATGIAVVIGIIVGGLMGYFSGAVDLIGMRFVEIFSAIPTLLLLLCFVAFFQVNLAMMMVIIGLTSWVGYALFIRAEFLRLRQQDFVQAARACGLPLWSILFRHMLPNGITPVLVSASFGVASAILAESTLSFLGIGLVEEASWGKLLNQALGVGGTFYWWIALYPGLAIFLTVFAYNLVGEALRDALDPHAEPTRM